MHSPSVSAQRDIVGEIMFKLNGDGLKKEELGSSFGSEFAYLGVSVRDFLHSIKLEGQLSEFGGRFFLVSRVAELPMPS